MGSGFSSSQLTPTASIRRAASIAAAGVGFTFIVILVGVWTRLSDAGLGCPDWPGCYGALVVPSADRAADFAPDIPLEPFKAWVEMFHRYIASGLGLVALTLAWMAWRLRRVEGYPVFASFMLLLVICLQGAFGAWTVTLKLWPQVVTLHLLGGFAVLCTFFWLFRRLSGCLKGDAQRRRPPFLWWLVGLVLVGQVALGGWTSSNYAGIACTGFPTCNQEWWPSYMDFDEGFHLTQEVGPNYLHGQLHAGARTAIHYTHRLGALALGIALLMLFLFHRRQRKVRAVLISALIVYAVQLSLGIILVLFSLPMSVALLHTAGAALLLLILLDAGWRLGATRSSMSSMIYKKVAHA